MERIIIIGASGYLGKAFFCSELFQNKIGTYCNNPSLGLVHLNLFEKESIINFIVKYKPDLIIYTAGLTNVDFCEERPDIAYYLNSEVLSFISHKSGAKIVYFSTDYVFNGLAGSYTEQSIPDPINIYGKSKLKGENAVLQGSSKNLVLRVSGLFGPSTLLKVTSKYSSNDNRITSPISVENVCQVTNVLLKNNESGIFHIAGNALSRYEFQQILFFYSFDNNTVVPTFYSDVYNAVPRPKNTSLKSAKLSKYNIQIDCVSSVLKKRLLDKNTNSYQIDTILNKIIKCNKRNILFDCVGAIMSRREWLDGDIELQKLDYLLGSGADKEEIKIKSKIIDDNKFENKIYKVAELYTLNPAFWDFLSYFKKNNYQIILVNNGLSKTFRYWVNKYGFFEIFDYLINSEEIGYKKPDINFFNICAKMLNCTLHDLLLIDDNSEIVSKANKLGITAIKTDLEKKFPVSVFTIT